MLCTVGPVLGSDQVFLAVPLSLQPYFIAESGEGLTYETVQAAFAAKGRRIFPVYVRRRDRTDLLARRQQVACAALQTERDSQDCFSVDDLYTHHHQAVSLTANGIEIRDVNDLKDKRIIASLRSTCRRAGRACRGDLPRALSTQAAEIHLPPAMGGWRGERPA